MRYCRLLICVAALACLALQVSAQEGDFLADNLSGVDPAAQEMSQSMNSDIFNVANGNQNSQADPRRITSISSPQTGESEATSTGPASLSIAGNWHFEMTDSVSRTADITLYQSGDIVYGKGTIAAGNDRQDVTAKGSLFGSKLELDVLPVRDIGLFEMSLILGNGGSTGSYNVYSPAFTSPVAGTVTATASA